jgi:hypothetical protein
MESGFKISDGGKFKKGSTKGVFSGRPSPPNIFRGTLIPGRPLNRGEKHATHFYCTAIADISERHLSFVIQGRGIAHSYSWMMFYGGDREENQLHHSSAWSL